MERQTLRALAIILTLTAGIVAISGCSKKGQDLEVQTPVSGQTSESKDPFPHVSLNMSCASHKMCPAGAACLQDKCVSFEGISCAGDLECPEFEKCYNGRCAACATAQDCSMGFTCNEHGVCVPENPAVEHCSSAADCTGGAFCYNGKCSSFCTNNYDCGAAGTAACASKNEMLVGICLSGSLDNQCGASCGDSCDFECEGSKVCLNATCYAVKCSKDSDCGEGKFCSDGECKEKQCESDDACHWKGGVCRHFVCGCENDAECGDEGYCKDGKCERAECKTDEDCGRGKCREYVCGCENNAECGDDGYCKDGECHSKECETDEECDGRGKCRNYVCSCENDEECGEDLICDDDNTCVNVQCEQDDDCDNEEPCMKGRCNGCSTDSDCNGDKHCLNKVTYSSYYCINGDCEYSDSTVSKGKYCLECTDNSHCPGDKPFCILHENKCFACLKDNDCADGFECDDDNTCVEMSEEDKRSAKAPVEDKTCLSNADCERSEYCSYQQKCKPAAVKCSSDADCGEDVKCNKYGYCKATLKKYWGVPLPELCSTDEHCGRLGGSKCNPIPELSWDGITNNYKYISHCEYLCSTAEDCEEGESCILGKCLTDKKRDYCQMNSDCSEHYSCNTFYHECVPAQNNEEEMDLEKAMKIMQSMVSYGVSKMSVECLHKSDCKDDLICLASGQCGCMSNDHCSSGQKCNSKNICECVMDEGCEAGFACVEGDHFEPNKCKCTSDEACGSDGLCSYTGNCVKSNNVAELYDHGFDYHYGIVHPADLAKAVTFYKKAEELGHPLASIQLGLIAYDKAKASKKPTDKIELNIKNKLAELDEKQAKLSQSEKRDEDMPLLSIIETLMKDGSEDYLRAILMLRGIGVEKNVDEALSALNRLQERGYMLAKYTLAREYITGEHVSKDLKKAEEIYKMNDGYIVNNVSAYGFYQLAVLAANTPNFIKNESDYKQYVISNLVYAAKIGNYEAEYQVSAFFGVNGLGDWELGHKDEEDYLTHAAKFGHAGAAKRLDMRKNWNQFDNGESKNVLQKDALSGSSEACDKLRKFNDADKCSKQLAKDGLFVGNYIQLLSKI